MKKLIVLFIVLGLVACTEPEFSVPGPEPGTPSIDLAAANSPLTGIPTLKDIVEKGVIVGRMTCRVQSGARIFAALKDGHKFYVFNNGLATGSVCNNIVYNETGMETVNAGDDINAWDEFNAELSGKVKLWEKE